MRTWKIATITGVALVAAVLLASMVFGAGMMGGNYGGYGGMMGGGYGNGYGYNSPPYTTQTGATNLTAPTSHYYQPVYPFMYGAGMMGRLGNGGYGGMMSSYGYGTPYPYTGTPLNIITAVKIAQAYIASIGNPDLVVKQVEEYNANFYVQVNEKSTGNGAFELLINKYTGSIYPEMGPNMMWNTKYGMMRSGIVGGFFGVPTTTMPVSATQATAYAQQYLNSYLPGTTTGDVATFYGYYTIEVLSNSTTYGMMSINGYSGQVWVHTWHGTFIQEQQVS